jgi:hypothetical protein
VNGRDERERRFDSELREALRRADSSAHAGCVDEETLAVYVEGKLGRSERRALEQHVASCPRCRETLGFLAVAEPDARPAPRPAFSLAGFWRPALATLATASIAAVVAVRLFPETERRTAAPSPPARLEATEALRKSLPTPAAPPAELDRESLPRAKLDALPPAARSDPALAEEKKALDDRAAVKEQSRDERESSGPAFADRDGLGRVTGNELAAGARRQPAAPEPVAPKDAPVAAADATPSRLADSRSEGGESESPMARSSPARSDRMRSESVAPGPGGRLAPEEPEERAATDSFARERTEAARGASAAADGGPTAAAPSAWRLTRDGRSIERLDPRSRVWGHVLPPPGVEILAVAGPTVTSGWAVGTRGSVHRSTDGSTWQEASRPTEEDLVAVTAASADVATVVSRSGARFETDDGGRSWTALSVTR